MTRGGKRKGAGRPAEFEDPKRMAFVLEQSDWARLRAEADRLETTPSALVRQWVLARLDTPRR